MKYIDLTLKKGGSVPQSPQLFNFKWSESSPGTGWVEADGQWISSSSKGDAYNELVNNLSGVNSELLYVNNYSKIGDVVVNSSKVASGFSNDDYVQSSYVTIPTNLSSCVVYIKAKYNSLSHEYNIVWKSSTEAAVSFNNAGKPSLYCSSSSGWKVGTTVYNENDVVWFKLISTKSGSYVHHDLYSLLDNDYTLATLPDNGWVQEAYYYPTSFALGGYQFFSFGNNFNYQNEYLDGSVYLEDFFITFNDNKLFKLVESQTLNNNGMAVFSSTDDINNSAFYAIVDTANTRFKLPNPNYKIPADKPNLKLYFYLG